MVDVRLSGPSMAARLAARQRNSGEGTNPSTHVVHGSGDRRTHHNIHDTRVKQSGPVAGVPKKPAGPIG